jgi:hypothetical protein
MSADVTSPAPNTGNILADVDAFLESVKPFIQTRFGRDVTDSRHVKELRAQADVLQKRVKEAQEDGNRLFPMGSE